MSSLTTPYEPQLERVIAQIEHRLGGGYPLPSRAVAVLLLAGDPEIADWVAARDVEAARHIEHLIAQARTSRDQPLAYILARQRQATVDRLLDGVLLTGQAAATGSRERLSQALMNPVTGLPLLALALAALYLFVGVLGAQGLVGWMEETVFGAVVTPWAERIALALIPWNPIRDLLVGPYGIVTLALRYAFAIILPIVGTFFLAFAVIEDSGYLPRLATLIDRSFKRIGLSGRAVIPMVLGFGCDTMATIVTRTLETGRERLIATILLALAIPCSAQMGVVLAILAGHPGALAVWVLSVLGVFLVVGFLAARLVGGERPAFFMELPPLRLPTLSGVLVKTLARLEWYLREVLPVFVLVSVILWLGERAGVFSTVVGLLRPAVQALGLPGDTAVAFLLGFFRRDYGAAGLYDLRNMMSGNQRAVAAVTLTLFVPCMAQFAVMLRERGWKTALAVLAFILPFAFLVGGALSWGLTALRVSL
jgi:ferrous iron transport protein B